MSENKKYTNKLINENSPYLLQHAHNPVNWYPWGDEALKKAEAEDKLILISIGYSACHWCHVMEKESFENEDIAKLMNDNFVCIKVDREEHPDVDQVYMTAVQIMTGSGGWPLNCIALPDGRPVYGGTYFRPEQWKHVLISLSSQYKTDNQKFIKTAESLQSGIRESEFTLTDIKINLPEFEEIENAVEKQKNKFDYEDGGFNRAPKFPLPSFWQFLLEYSYYSDDESIKEHLNLTLDKMAFGGLYDQLAGGFARYSVDSYWKVPHFEKMLYDNAQLISLYSYAYQYFRKPLYKKIVSQTLEFIENEMTSDESGFYSSYDADSEGEEGKFYIWKKDEIEKILGDDAKLFCDYYNVTSLGNWEQGKNILFVDKPLEKFSKKYDLSEDQIKNKLKFSSEMLLKERDNRVKPGLDDKILTSWNAMMIGALVDAYIVFNKQEYLDRAERSMSFLLKNMLSEDSNLLRSYKKGNAKINGLLDDYAFMIDACLKLFQVTGDDKYISVSKQLTDRVIDHFYDKETGMFFYVSDIDFNLIVRQKEISDNVIPASNSVMTKNLYRMGLIYSDNMYFDMSLKMINSVHDNTIKNIDFFGNWASSALMRSVKQYELIIVGNDHKTISRKLMNDYRPDVFISVKKGPSDLSIFKDRFVTGKTMIYVCKNNVCDLPETDPKKAILKLKTD